MNARVFEGGHLLCGSSLPAGDDCACVAHAPSRRRGLSGNEGHDWFRHVLFRERSSFLFSRAANLSDHYNAVSLFVFLKESQSIDMGRAHDRIASDSNRRGLTETKRRQLPHRFVSQSSGARNHPNTAFAMNVTWHDADLALSR